MNSSKLKINKLKAVVRWTILVRFSPELEVKMFQGLFRGVEIIRETF
jgi:hypothetical protein